MGDKSMNILHCQYRDRAKQGSTASEDMVMNGFPDSKVHGANMGPIWGRQD